MVGVAEEAEDKWLIIIVVAQPLLVDFEGVEAIVLAYTCLAFVQQVLLPSLHLVQLPLATPLSETEEVRPYIHVAPRHSELHIFATAPFHLLTP